MSTNDDSTAPPSTPADDQAIANHGKRCPRCGSTWLDIGRVSLNRTHHGAATEGKWYTAYDRVHGFTVCCRGCRLLEHCADDEEGFQAFEERWRDKRRKTSWAEVDRINAEGDRLHERNRRAETWPVEPAILHDTQWRDRFQQERGPKLYPENEALLAEVIAHPDDDAPRWAYAAWMKQQAPLVATCPPEAITWHIEAQLQIAAALRADPKADIAPLLVLGGTPEDYADMRGGGYTGSERRFDIKAMDDVAPYSYLLRGFVEHVAMKAKYFLMFADELFRRAPIRHLTLTYCADYIEQLAASPHLARIRSLRLPNRIRTNEYPRLNDLRDEHMRVLASSPHLGKLAYLDLEDNDALTPRAFDHLALSGQLPSLSHVRLDCYRYERQFGALGGEFIKSLAARKAIEWTAQLEARHGYLPWLHADEHYGAASPENERVTEHPVGNAALRPDVASRRRPQLPAALARAIVACLDPATGALRERALVAMLPAGRLVGTIERAEPHPDLPEILKLVTLTIQQLPSTPLQLFDHAAGRLVQAASRATITVVVKAPRGPVPAEP